MLAFLCWAQAFPKRPWKPMESGDTTKINYKPRETKQQQPYIGLGTYAK